MDFCVIHQDTDEILLTHRFSATVGRTKIKVPRDMHSLRFYKGDTKELTNIQNKVQHLRHMPFSTVY